MQAEALVVTTRNTEYLMRMGECVAARDIGTHEWQYTHMAVGRSVLGRIRQGEDGRLRRAFGSLPRRGESFLLSENDDDREMLITSSVQSILSAEPGKFTSHVPPASLATPSSLPGVAATSRPPQSVAATSSPPPSAAALNALGALPSAARVHPLPSSPTVNALPSGMLKVPPSSAAKPNPPPSPFAAPISPPSSPKAAPVRVPVASLGESARIPVPVLDALDDDEDEEVKPTEIWQTRG